MFKTVLVATDGSTHARKAIEVAADIATKYDARLVVVHVLLRGEIPESLRRLAEVEEPAGRSPHVADGDLGSALANTLASAHADRRTPNSGALLAAVGEEVLDLARATARDHGVEDIATRLEEGHPVEQILKAATEENADLVVCGARGLSNLRALLAGSVSHKLSHLSPVTCITVR